MFTAIDIQIITTPVRAPRANAIAQRFVGTIRRELLDRLLIINQRHAAAVLREFQRHYNHHRPHRRLGQAAPARPLPQVRSTDAYVHADMVIKEKALALTRPVTAKPGRYRPTDKTLAFLDSL